MVKVSVCNWTRKKSKLSTEFIIEDVLERLQFNYQSVSSSN